MKPFICGYLLLGALIACYPPLVLSQVPASQDTIVIPGGTLAGRENQGLLESTINGDTTGAGTRVNPNRVYALNEGQYYFQTAPIMVNNPTGTLNVCGVPSAYGRTKPVILIANTGSTHVVVHLRGTNLVYGSLKFENIYYVSRELDGYQNGELFYCGTKNKLPQSLTINNCMFEFCILDLFDCTSEPDAIGGWPYGAKFRITNSYFRNMFNPGQWWGSRVFQCRHPIDTLWVENCTVTTGGLTFLQQNELTDFMYINHNTFVNNTRYWFFSPYHHDMFITNNIFINQNWVGEDTNVISGNFPFKQYTSTIIADTNNIRHGLLVQGKYYAGDSSHFTHDLDLNRLKIYVSDNVNYYDPLLINGYYQSGKYKLAALNALPSYLTWTYPTPPFPVENVPCEWMNSHTKDLFAAFAPPNGGFLERRTDTSNPGTVTPPIADASVVDSMAAWNQNQWGDPRFPRDPNNITSTKFIYGDFLAATLPGIVNGVRTDTMTTGAAGIVKFTDLTENFSHTGHLSAIDGLPIGALIWDDAKLAAFNSSTDLALVWGKYIGEGGLPLSVETTTPGHPAGYSLAQNYPNPFNPATTIRYGLPARTRVALSVFNTLGQHVAILVNESQESGFHDVRFEAGGLASGVYFYRLKAGNYVETKRFVLLR